MFQLPAHAATYIDAIFDRTTTLIDAGIWNDLDRASVRRWYRNFNDLTDRYFAACLLDSFIYRSKNQTKALARQLFQRVLVDLSRSDPMPIDACDCLQILQNVESADSSRIRVIPAVSAQRAGPSGDVIARLLRQKLGVHPDLLIDPSEAASAVDNGVEMVLVVDDFLGTGDRFQKTVLPHLMRISRRCYTVFCPFVAHQEGIDHLRASYGSIRIATVERLTSDYGVFSDRSSCFADGLNTAADALQFYLELLDRKGIRSDDPLGTGNQQLAYAFEHGTPQNTLPIFWWPETSTWSPLVER